MEDGVTHRLAGTHDGAQVQPVALPRRGHGLHHRLQRRRKEKRVGDGVALHQLERPLGREAALVGDDAAAEVQRRQQRVDQAAGPGPVGRAPEHAVRVLEPGG